MEAIADQDGYMSSDLEPELLRAFVAVVEAGGFTAAARRLHRTQGAVSTQIRRLEERVGRRLVERTSRGIRLDPGGERFLAYARRIVALGDEAVRAMRADPVLGTVRLGCMEDYATLVLPSLLAEFGAAQPEVAVSVRTGLTGRLLPELGSGLDLVLAMHPAALPSLRPLRQEQAVWIAPLLRRHEDEPVLPLAVYPQGCLLRAWALSALDAAARPWRIVYESGSLAAVEAAVAAGLAIGVSKAGTARADLRRPDRLPALPAASIALHRPPAGASLAAMRLADFLEMRLRR